MVSGQFHYTMRNGFVPFLLTEILNFQCSTHLIGVGSLSKLNKANNFDMEVPTLYLDETLIVNDYPRAMSESLLDHFREKDREYFIKSYKESLPDKESLEIFNIQIIPGYFKWNPYYAMFREYDQ